MGTKIKTLPGFVVLLLYFWVSLFMFACEQQPQEEISFEVTEVKALCSARFQKGDSIPYDDRWLVRALPQEVQFHEVAEQKGSNWPHTPVAFSQAEKTFLSDEFGYVLIRIGDYAADTSAFHHLLDTYNELPDESKKFIRPQQKAFGWINYEPQRQFFNLQAGINYRFGLDIRIFKKKLTSEKIGKGQLWKIWESIDFNQLMAH